MTTQKKPAGKPDKAVNKPTLMDADLASLSDQEVKAAFSALTPALQRGREVSYEMKIEECSAPDSKVHYHITHYQRLIKLLQEVKNPRVIDLTKKQPQEEPAKKVDLYEIPLSQISPDPNQPRKFFDEEKLKELAASIGNPAIGLIQPILIRPAINAPGGVNYLIIAGERRYRASLIAGLPTIKAMIQPMSDDQALEIQITENIQRSNPHPIEDAAALEAMRRKPMTLNEISLRIGKGTKYIAGRLLLNNLLPEFQEMFFHNIFHLENAINLAKLSHPQQSDIYKQFVGSRDWRAPGFEMYNLSSIVNRKNSTFPLDSATFKTEDPSLYPQAGPCGSCIYNSSNNLTLFTDDKPRICSNPTCWAIKTDIALKAKVAELVVDPKITFISNEFYLTTEAKSKIAAAEEVGAKVLSRDDYKIVENREKPVLENFVPEKQDFEEFLKDRLEEMEDTNLTPKQKEKEIKEEYEKEYLPGYEEEYNEAKADFEEELSIYETYLSDIEKAKTEGKIIKAFVVTGKEEGKFIEIIPQKSTFSNSETDSKEPSDEIAAIREREARAKELDAEKVWIQIQEFSHSADISTYFNSFEALTITELRCLCQAMLNQIGISNEILMQIFKIDKWQEGNKMAKIIEKADEETLERWYNRLCRELMRNTLFPTFGSHLRDSGCYMGRHLLTHYAQSAIAKIEDAQSEIAQKRALRVNQRIAEITKRNQS